ncbi:MAG TPA: Clp protease N-terminal domain-containing protein, partial [Acidimicrobiales bacterium]|nr:Clp protease N-terminal domain-containing protein [Acidimicrobiales bacterium]
MNPEKLTQKSQEALQAAQSIALRYGHSAVDGEHLLLALLEQPDGLVPRLLAAVEADTEGLRRDLEADLERLPRVS